MLATLFEAQIVQPKIKGIIEQTEKKLVLNALEFRALVVKWSFALPEKKSLEN